MSTPRLARRSALLLLALPILGGAAGPMCSSPKVLVGAPQSAPVPGTWHVVDSPTTGTLRAVWATAPDDVWAGGDGAILHWDGTAWSVSLAMFERSFTSQLWASGPADVWAAGAYFGADRNATLLHYDGASWSIVNDRNSAPTSVWGLGPNDVWAAFTPDGVAHWDGTSWTVVDRQAFDWTYRITGSADTGPLWVDAFFRMLVDGRWQSLGDHNPATSDDSRDEDRYAYGAWAGDRDSIWVVGQGAWHWAGSRWEAPPGQPPSTPGHHLFGAWGAAGNSVWFTGMGGQILHYDGAGLSLEASPTTATLRGVHGTSARDVWAVGENGTILHRTP